MREPIRPGRPGGLRTERLLFRLHRGIAVERVGGQVDKGLVEVGDDRAVLTDAQVMEEDADILEAGATDIDQANAELIEAEPEHLLNQDRNEDFFGIAFDQKHALCEQQVAAHGVEVALDVADLAGIETGGRLEDLANPAIAPENVDVLDVADLREMRRMR